MDINSSYGRESKSQCAPRQTIFFAVGGQLLKRRRSSRPGTLCPSQRKQGSATPCRYCKLRQLAAPEWPD